MAIRILVSVDTLKAVFFSLSYEILLDGISVSLSYVTNKVTDREILSEQSVGVERN